MLRSGFTIKELKDFLRDLENHQGPNDKWAPVWSDLVSDEGSCDALEKLGFEWVEFDPYRENQCTFHFKNIDPERYFTFGAVYNSWAGTEYEYYEIYETKRKEKTVTYYE